MSVSLSSPFWWIFDVLFVLIAGYVIYSNAKRGLTKVLVVCIGYVAATLLASVLAAAGAPALYESVARSSNLSALQTVNQKVDFPQVFQDAIDGKGYGFVSDKNIIGEILRTDDPERPFDMRLCDYVNDKTGGVITDASEFTDAIRRVFVSRYGAQLEEHLPRYVSYSFQTAALRDPEIMRNLIGAVCAGQHRNGSAAEYVEDLFGREPTTEALRIFVYLIIFSVMMVFATVLASALQNKIFINVRTSTDHLMGGVIGLLECGALLVLMVIVVRLVVLLSGGKSAFFSEETIANTYIFHYLYDQIGILL